MERILSCQTMNQILALIVPKPLDQRRRLCCEDGRLTSVLQAPAADGYIQVMMPMHVAR
jgi:hypothetical protein